MGSPTPGADQTDSDFIPQEEMSAGVIPLAVDVALIITQTIPTELVQW